jgi:hypothetical protein
MSINFSNLEHKVHESDDSSSESADNSEKSKKKFMEQPDPDLPPPLSASEKTELEMLKTMLELYRDNLTCLQSFESTEGLTLQEVRSLKSRLDANIVSGAMINAYEESFWMAVKTVEKMAIKANYDLTGWTEACAADKNIVNDVRFIIINYVGRLRIRPELRLAINMGRKAYMINSINEARAIQNSPDNQKLAQIPQENPNIKPVEFSIDSNSSAQN